MRSVCTIILLSLVILACKKSESIAPDTLTGTWIEQTARQDTLIFNFDQDGTPLPGWLTVSRGNEPTPSGQLVPKIGNGIYSYRLDGNRIFVRNMLLSSSFGSDYAIEQVGDRLKVENFYELGYQQAPTATRTLVRLR